MSRDSRYAAWAIDWTDFDSDKQTTLAIHRVTRHGRATPLLWMSVSKRSLKRNRNRYEGELLHRLKAVLPNGVKVTVLADSGFGYTDFYHVLSHVLEFDFVIRFRGNIKVTSSKGETRNANDWVGKQGRARTLRNAKVTAKGVAVPVVARRNPYRCPSRIPVARPDCKFLQAPVARRCPR